jgi:TRAP-type C4-dicarboxylate transport system substrate-binding protein
MPFSPLSAWVSIVNKSAFDALPEDLKPAIIKACKEIEDAYWDAEEKDANESIKKLETAGLKIVPPPSRATIEKDFVPLMEKVWGHWVKRCEEKGIPGRDILNQTRTIVKKIRGK